MEGLWVACNKPGTNGAWWPNSDGSNDRQIINMNFCFFFILVIILKIDFINTGIFTPNLYKWCNITYALRSRGI